MIKNNNPLPVWSKENSFPIEGTLFEIPDICSKAKNKWCRKHYDRIEAHRGFHICPMGLSSYSTGEPSANIITAVRIADAYDNSKIKASCSFLPTLPKTLVLSSIKKSRNQKHQTPNEPTRPATPQQITTSNDSELIDFSLHEVRKFNRQIKRYSEEILHHIESIDKKTIEAKVKSIFASSSMMSIRLNIYDFEANPDIVTAQMPLSTSIYKKFDKARRILDVYAKDRGVKILPFDGNSYLEISAYQILDFLPFVIMENAIKYSPRDQEVSVKFEDDKESLTIITSSFGPLNTKEELRDIFGKRFRGEGAQIVDNGGGGYGLYFGKLICDMHDIGITVDSDQSYTNFNGIKYSTFTVTLNIKKNRN